MSLQPAAGEQCQREDADLDAASVRIDVEFSSSLDTFYYANIAQFLLAT